VFKTLAFLFLRFFPVLNYSVYLASLCSLEWFCTRHSVFLRVASSIKSSPTSVTQPSPPSFILARPGLLLCSSFYSGCFLICLSFVLFFIFLNGAFLSFFCRTLFRGSSFFFPFFSPLSLFQLCPSFAIEIAPPLRFVPALADSPPRGQAVITNPSFV